MRPTLAVLTMFLLAGVCSAQSCGSVYSGGYTYRQTYHAPSYVPPKHYSYKSYDYHEEYVPVKFKLAVLAYPLIELGAVGAAYVPPTQSVTPQPLQQPNSQAPKSPAASSEMQQLLTAQTQILTALKTLDERTAKIEERVNKLERVYEPSKQQVQPQPEQGPTPKQEDDIDKTFTTSNTASCAMCHSRSNAAKYGNGFVYSEDDGRINPNLTAEQREEVNNQLQSGKMPKLKGARAEATKPKPLTQETYNAHARAMDKQRRLAAAAKQKPQAE